jgi:hypothetical protein
MNPRHPRSGGARSATTVAFVPLAVVVLAALAAAVPSTWFRLVVLATELLLIVALAVVTRPRTRRPGER